MLDRLPLYQAQKLANSYSIGVPGGMNENGPPYKAYVTWRWYSLRRDVSCPATEAFYAHALEESGWTTIGWSGLDRSQSNEVVYYKGHAEFDVLCLLGRPNEPNSLGFHVDYNDYPRGSH